MGTPEDLARAELARFLDDLREHCEQRCKELGRELPVLILVGSAGPYVAASGNVDTIRGALLRYLSIGEPTPAMYQPRRPFGPL